MKFKVNGKVLDASHMRVREVCEAEKALGVDASAERISDKTAVALFVGKRRAEPEKPAALIASEVMDTELEAFGEIEEEESDVGPPAQAPAAGGSPSTEDPESQQTSGPLRSVQSG